MSYPSSLDLAFGSEKATADPMGRLSFGKGGGSTDLPTTPDELNEMIGKGLAVAVLLNGSTLDLSDRERISQAQVDSLPENLSGIVYKEPPEDLIESLSYSVSTDPSLEIIITSVLEEMPKSVFLILKQAVD